MNSIDANTLDERAQRCLEAYLRGLNQGGHDPLSPVEVAETYEAIRTELKRRSRVPA